MSNKNKWLDYLLNIDRRVVYVIIFLSVALPFFLNPVVDIQPTKWVSAVYDEMEEAARTNKPIIIGFDYDPSTLAELDPMAKALLRHAFSRNIKVLGLNFIANGTSLAAMTMDDVAKEFGKEYGKDYVFLPFMPQYDLVLLNFGDNFRKSYTQDFRGQSLENIPMLSNLQNYDDFHMVIDISGTKLPTIYIMYGVTRYHFKFVTGCTAVSATEYFPYLQSGQMIGLITGMKGAAEYEGLVKAKLNLPTGDGMKGMASQTWGHIVIIIFIVIGNILYYVRRRMNMESK